MDDTIYKRKSCRHYLMDELDDTVISDLKDFIENAEPLIPDIKTDYKIVKKDKVKTVLNWSAPYYLALFSENKENYLTNIGFIYQQVDLYLQSKGLGSCWVGLASYKEDSDLEFIIFIGFGKPSESLYRDISEFKRKNLNEISDNSDTRLKPAQYAPSAVNSQPWYFKHNNDNEFDVYCKKQNIVKRKLIGKMNKIDIGIALAHLYISNDNFTSFRNKNPEKIKNHEYIISIRI